MNARTTTPTTSTQQLVFAQPGPGGWKRLADHFPGALTPEYQRIYAATCPPGSATYMARYGVLAAGLDVAFVHGHLYVTPAPLTGPREIKRPPPALAVWVLSRVHPAFRRRNRAARRALAGRPWRDVALHWFAAEREQWWERSRALQEIAPDHLGDAELAGHLDACRALVLDGYRRHFELHGDDLLPVGLLLARCRDWGIDPTVAATALRGARSPVGEEEPEPWMLITGYDLDSLARGEMRATTMSPRADVDAVVDLHDVMPATEHGELDELLADAAVAVSLRDDNGMITAAWPMGLLRRAMLTAGGRLGLADPTLGVELTVEELTTALRGGPGLAPDDVGARRRDRAQRSALDAPLSLGPEFAIPPLAALPRPLARIGAAQLAASDHMFGTDRPVGVGSRQHVGRALVVDDPTVALDLVEQGDVVITAATSPAWNVVLAHAGALVTAYGGLVSHAAVIARELDIPAVIGDRDALHRFRTGDRVLVDPVDARVVETAAHEPGGASS